MAVLDVKKERSIDVIATGRASVDFVPDSYGPTSSEHRYTKFLGGSPANTAVAMAQHQIRTGYIGKVGTDIPGDYLISYMTSKGIDTSHIARSTDPAVRTGMSIAELLAPNVKRSNLYRSNVADLYISPDELDEAYIASAGILLVSGASLTDSPAREAVFLAIEYAKRNNVRVVLDPDYRAQSWHSETEASIYYTLAIQQCDGIITTRDEMDVLNHAYARQKNDDQTAAQMCLDHGLSFVIIKHGEDGSEGFLADGSHVHQDAFPSRVISLQGAGDSYSGAFMSEIIRGSGLHRAMEYASASAALTVSGRSCSEHMPSRAMTEEFMHLCKAGRAAEWVFWE